MVYGIGSFQILSSENWYGIYSSTAKLQKRIFYVHVVFNVFFGAACQALIQNANETESRRNVFGLKGMAVVGSHRTNSDLVEHILLP